MCAAPAGQPRRPARARIAARAKRPPVGQHPATRDGLIAQVVTPDDEQQIATAALSVPAALPAAASARRSLIGALVGHELAREGVRHMATLAIHDSALMAPVSSGGRLRLG